MDKKLTISQILQLIGLYRSHSLLWDMNNKAYRRNDLKIRAYDEIALEMHMPADIVRRKIRALRSTYTAEKKKIADSKKSGSEDEVYVPTILWFEEMSFLDSLIVTRKSSDNSKQDIGGSSSFDYYIEIEADTCDESFTDPKPTKRPRVREQSKFNKALDKLISINDSDTNEFNTFGTSIGQQLQKLPEEDAYELMGEIQNLLTKRKLKNLRKQRILQQPLTTSTANTLYDQSSDSLMKCSSFMTARMQTSTKTSSSSLISPSECSSISDILDEKTDFDCILPN